MANGTISRYDKTAMLRCCQRNMVLNGEYTSKVRTFKGTLDERVDSALRWVYRYVLPKDPIFIAQYESLLPKARIKKEYPNPLTDELELIVNRKGWRCFRQALVDYALRRVEDDQFIGLPGDKWNKILTKFETLLKEPDR